jgi:hypothetical protein
VPGSLPSDADTAASPETPSSTIATPSHRKLSSLEELLAEALAKDLHEAGPRGRLDLLYLQILMRASSEWVYTQNNIVVRCHKL